MVYMYMYITMYGVQAVHVVQNGPVIIAAQNAALRSAKLLKSRGKLQDVCRMFPAINNGPGERDWQISSSLCAITRDILRILRYLRRVKPSITH